MKVLSSLGFLITVGLFVYLSRWRQKRELAELGSMRSVAEHLMFQLFTVLLAFAGYWLLTRVFPARLILLLAAALCLAAMLHLLIGAITGFTLPEKQRKVATLAFLRSFEKGLKSGMEGRRLAPNAATMGVFALIWLVSVVASLWAFWRYPLGSAAAKVLIVFFQFTLPFLAATAVSLLIMWPIVASESVDDDLRSYHLSWGFSSALFLTIYLLFPLWILGEDIRTVFAWFPSMWVLVSAPLIIFLIGYVFPFFVGMYLFRHEVRGMVEWRETWLHEVLTLLQLPAGEARSRRLAEKFGELEREITRYLAANALFKFYLYIATGGAGGSEALLPAIEPSDPQYHTLAASFATVRRSSAVPALRRGPPAVRPSQPEAGANVEELKERLKGLIGERAVDVLWESIVELPEWDIRFGYVYKLNELRQLAAQNASADIAGYIKAAAEEAQQQMARLSERKNILAAAFLSVVSAVIVWLFKTFEPQIASIIKDLVPSLR